MDVDIDPNDDKASQGDDADAPPLQVPALETGPRRHGVRGGGSGRK